MIKYAALCANYKVLYPLLWGVAHAIKRFEGWAPGTVSWRNNNPGNLRSSALASSADEGYATFASYEMGMYALLLDLAMKCRGKTSTSLTPLSTLLELVRVYAPADDDNQPDRYAVFIAEMVDGVRIDTPIWRLLEDR